jgi:hypothetical protein
MNFGCIAEDRLPLISDLPPDDPARHHLAHCARCRGRVAALEAFSNPRTQPAGSRVEQADAHLASILHREIYGPSASRALLEARTTEKGGIGSILRILWRPGLRPVWAVGIVLLAIAGFGEIQRTRDDRIVLREDGRPATSALLLHESTLGKDDRITLRWSPKAGATYYAVVLLDADLEEQRRIETGPDPTWTLETEDSASLRAGAYPFWRVIALRDGDVIGSSKTAPLLLPRTP